MVLSEDWRRDNEWTENEGCIVLSVRDTGTGMDSETRQHVFEPFFTTKALGKGTGLGLATVYGIVRQHKGVIQVESELERGTTFTIFLPICMETVQPTQEIQVLLPEGGNETILVAEDNNEVRGLAAQILRDAGYVVLEAEDGQEAIRVFDSHMGEIRLALLDIVMPKCGGRAVSQHIRSASSGVGILFASGYVPESFDENVLQEKGIEFIEKPYKKNDLLNKVRIMLVS